MAFEETPALHCARGDGRGIGPSDATAKDYLARLASLDQELGAARAAAQRQPAPEQYLELSLLEYRAGRFERCIDAAKQALELRPDYAPAFNNIAAAYNAQKRWARD